MILNNDIRIIFAIPIILNFERPTLAMAIHLATFFNYNNEGPKGRKHGGDHQKAFPLSNYLTY